MKKSIRILAAILVVAAMSVSVFAENFTPSVEQKGAPDVVVTKDSNQNDVVAIIHDGSDKEVYGVPAGKLIVTPYAQAKEASPEIEKMLTDAYQQIKQTKTLANLTAELNDAVAKLKEEMGIKELKVENLVVRDLVDVSLDSELKAQYLKDGNTISVTFDLGMKADEPLLVLHNYEADKWEVIANDCVVRHDNGNVTITFDSLSPVAFVVDGTVYGAQTEQGPATGDTNNAAMWIGAIVLAAGVAGVVVILMTKKKAH